MKWLLHDETSGSLRYHAPGKADYNGEIPYYSH